MNIAISVRKNVSKKLVEDKFSTFFNIPWPIFRQIHIQSSPWTENHLWILKDLDNWSNDVFLGIRLLISGPWKRKYIHSWNGNVYVRLRFFFSISTLKFLLYVPVRMPVRQYILCTAKTAQCPVRIIGALEYLMPTLTVFFQQSWPMAI